MPDTVTVGKNISIAFGAVPGNFTAATYFPGEILLKSVKIKGAAGSSLIVRNGSGTGEILSDFADSIGDGKKDPIIPAKWCIPYILASECTITNCQVILELE